MRAQSHRLSPAEVRLGGQPGGLPRRDEEEHMARIGESADLFKCSFCGKSQKQVQQLIAGPGVYICDECVELCNEIIEERMAESGEEASGEFELPKPKEI